MASPEVPDSNEVQDSSKADFSKVVNAVNEAHRNVAAALRALESITSLTSETDEIHEFCVTLKQLETDLQLKRAKESQDVQYKNPAIVDPQVA